MKNTDTYDLLLETLGYRHPASEITDQDLEIYQDQIYELKQMLGMTNIESAFSLVLLNDSIHDMEEVVIVLHDLIGLGNTESLEKMREAHTQGSAVIATGKYSELKPLLDELREDNYKVLIRKTEINQDCCK